MNKRWSAMLLACGVGLAGPLSAAAPTAPPSTQAAPAAASVPLAGDRARARQVWDTFERWLAAYAAADQSRVMDIFDPDLRFSFQGARDQTYAQMQAAYAKEFAARDTKKRWVPQVEEIYADGDMALVRAVWELRVTGADGREESKARNRSMDVFRRSREGEWRIFRSINYPEKAASG
ncbi:DUF4440 domain-containing protein [Lysobacter sp. 2RAB21]